METYDIDIVKKYARHYVRGMFKYARTKNRNVGDVGYVVLYLKTKNGIKLEKTAYVRNKGCSFTKAVTDSIIEKISNIEYDCELIHDKDEIKEINIAICESIRKNRYGI